MITRAYIYQRTITRPAIYYPLSLILTITPEYLIAGCILPVQLSKEAKVPDTITHTCALPVPVDTKCALPQPVIADCPLPQPVEETAQINTELNAITKVVP